MKIRGYPQRIALELTAECNLNCPACPRQYIKEEKGYMSADLWRRLIDDIFENSNDSVILPFWRGEALLHPDFIELMEYALNKSFRIYIATNGIFAVGKYAEVLSRCEFINFSLHNDIGYKHALGLLSFRHRGRPVIQASFVRGEEASQRICKKILVSDNLGGFDTLRIYERHSQEGVFGKSERAGAGPIRNFCPKLENAIVIAYDGRVSRCNHYWLCENKLNVGNRSIREIWDSEYFDKIRKEYPDDKCLQCDQWVGSTIGEAYHCVNGKIEHKVFGAACN